MQFLKTTILGGLFILAPLLVLWLVIVEVTHLLIAVATPIADLFPGETFENLHAPEIVAVLLIVGASFVLGLAARWGWLSGFGSKVEGSVLNRLPMYRMIKLMSTALIRSEHSKVDPALLRDGNGGGTPCYVMERHKDGRATVMLPWSPASFAGAIRVVQESELEPMPCSFEKLSRTIGLLGVGMEECMTQPESSEASERERSA